MAAARHYSPVKSLETMLSEASALDQEWGDINISPFWLIKNAVQVPVVIRVGGSRNEYGDNEPRLFLDEKA